VIKSIRKGQAKHAAGDLVFIRVAQHRCLGSTSWTQ
jgi:hypothetical protein